MGVPAPDAAPAGESDLLYLLRDMRPVLSPERWAFCHLPPDTPPPASLGAIVTVREAEGWTAVIPAAVANAAGLAHAGAYRQITLTVHSSLAAVGLTAAVSRALADAGIACNMVAGYYHDHAFVPEANAEAALAALGRLSASAAGSGQLPIAATRA
jgi:hypothetical protein